MNGIYNIISNKPCVYISQIKLPIVGYVGIVVIADSVGTIIDRWIGRSGMGVVTRGPVLIVVIIGGSSVGIFDVVWGPEVVVAIVVRVSVGVYVVTEHSVVNVGSAVVVVADLRW